MKTLLIATVICAGAVAARAQVSVSTEQSSDKKQSSSQISVTAGDHTFVPLTVETKKTEVDANTTRMDSTTQARQSDGTYFDWRTTRTEVKKLSDSATQSTSDTVEKDRQGTTRVTKSTTESVTKLPDGTENATTSLYRRDSSGGLVKEREIWAVSRPNPDGSINTIKVENRIDTNGALQPVERTQEHTTKVSDNESQTARTIQKFNHVDASFTDSAKETTIVRKNGDTTTTETVTQRPNGTVWQNQSKVTTTETHAADGTTQRETIQQARPVYAPADSGSASSASLVPREKIVEREVKRPDGTTVTDRQVLHRDINGDWKPDSFSTEAAQKGY